MKKTTDQNPTRSISEVLKHRILHLEYLPGHRFTEQALCDEFNVSRIPVREALGILIDMGLVDKVRHVGCRVRKLTLEDIDHIYELRVALELYAVEILAAKGNAADLIKDLVILWKRYAGTKSTEKIDPEFWADADEQFHETLLNTLENRQLSRALHEVNEKIRFLRVKDITTFKRLEGTCSKHLQILDAISRHDGPVARKLLHENILMGKANVTDSFQEAILKAYASAK